MIATNSNLNQLIKTPSGEIQITYCQDTRKVLSSALHKQFFNIQENSIQINIAIEKDDKINGYTSFLKKTG